MLDYIVKKGINLEHIEPVYAFWIGSVFVIHNAFKKQSLEKEIYCSGTLF